MKQTLKKIWTVFNTILKIISLIGAVWAFFRPELFMDVWLVYMLASVVILSIIEDYLPENN